VTIFYLELHQKKRKSSKSVQTNPEQILKDRLIDSLKVNGIDEQSQEKILENSNQLTPKFVEQLDEDISKKVENNSDFTSNSSKYPNTKQTGKRKKIKQEFEGV